MVSLKGVRFKRVVFPILLSVFVMVFAQGAFASVIGGNVYDQNRNALSQVDVELLDENYRTRDRTRTNGVGRYEFNNVVDGRYYVKVLPFRYDVEDEQQFVEVQTINLLGGGTGAAYFSADFYLAHKKGGLADTETGVIFAQSIPKEAEKLYKGAVKDFAKDRKAEGMTKLVKALEVHPKYYYALMFIGKQLLIRKQYLEAARAFIEAAEVNPKSSTAFYSMGLSLSQLDKKYNKAAIAALNKAAEIANSSDRVMYLLGKLERQEGNFESAEKYLVKAKKLAKVKTPEYHMELAQLYADDLKQFDKAADELEQYLKASKKKDKATKQLIDNLRAKAKSGS